MFALARDLLRYVQVNVQGPHLVVPDRCVLNSQPLRLARCGTWHPAGPSWRARRHRTARLKGGLDVTVGHLLVGCARASALTRTTSGSRGSGGRTSRQRGSRGTLGRWIRIRFTVCHLLSRSLQGRADGEPARLGDWFFGDGTSTRPGSASPESAHVGGIFRGRPQVPQTAFVVDGVAVWRLTGSPRRTLL
jgi:hypothetical protein